MFLTFRSAFDRTLTAFVIFLLASLALAAPVRAAIDYPAVGPRPGRTMRAKSLNTSSPPGFTRPRAAAMSPRTA